MVHSNVGKKHLHERKKAPVKKTNKWVRFLDTIMYPVGLVGPFMMIPQIYQIYSTQDASSIAVSSWAMFIFPATLWAVYGFTHKARVIVLSNAAWITTYILMVIGGVMY